MNGSNDNLRLQCLGFRVGAFTVPPFQLRSGEIARLAFSENSSDASHAKLQLLDALGGTPPHTNIRCTGEAAVAQPAERLRGVTELFHRQTLRRWLVKTTGRSAGDVADLLAAVDLRPDMPLNHASGNPRTILGVLAAMSSDAGLLVFWTAGMCNAMGEDKVLSLVFDQIGERAGIYVTIPLGRQNEFPFSHTIALERADTGHPRRALAS